MAKKLQSPPKVNFRLAWAQARCEHVTAPCHVIRAQGARVGEAAVAEEVCSESGTRYQLNQVKRMAESVQPPSCLGRAPGLT